MVSRIKTNPVKIGNILIGGENPIVIQSMTNTNTANTQATVKQIIKIMNNGGELVRTTVRNISESENLKKIINYLQAKNIKIPLSADVHFNSDIALIAAKYYDKVRINPGNFGTNNSKKEFTKEEYEENYQNTENLFNELLDICVKYGTAIRIGVNHGSLSKRILSKYGNTPNAMVESAMEFIRIAKKKNFDNIVVSLKSSNTIVMINAVELLVKSMNSENIYYPLHLGVTEAGESEDGIIKSCIGLGALLFQGIGDTIRVSLTCEPENEIIIAVKIKNFFDYKYTEPINFHFNNLLSNKTNYHLVFSEINDLNENNFLSDIVINKTNNISKNENNDIVSIHNKSINIINPDSIIINNHYYNSLSTKYFIAINYGILKKENYNFHSLKKGSIIILKFNNRENIFDFYSSKVYQKLNNYKIIFHKEYKETELIDFQINCSLEVSFGIIKDIFSGLLIVNEHFDQKVSINLAYSIFQSAQKRQTKTEYISCPSCGRTLFDIQKISKQIKEEIGYDKLIKIAVMGCIVNGPGEMADADYGYIGAGNNKVNIYRKQECIATQISEEKAIDFLKKEINEYLKQ